MKLRTFLTFIPLTAAMSACSSSKAVIPTILRGATAQGGWWGACPPSNQTEVDGIKAMGKLALSPEFNDRLETEFPPGSPVGSLVSSLQTQGFTDGGNCQSDPTIKLATFYARGTGFLPYATIAAAYWRADGDRIVWTKGFLMYSGL